MMTFQYTMCGLDYVFLRNGFQTHETAYGKGVSIERAESLDRAIAVAVISGYARLHGQEVRFLRSLIDFSQADLALHLGVKRITIARWEAAPHTPIPGPADRLLRLLAGRILFGGKWSDYIMDHLKEITDERPEPLYMTYRAKTEEDEPSLFEDAPADDDIDWVPAKAA